MIELIQEIIDAGQDSLRPSRGHRQPQQPQPNQVGLAVAGVAQSPDGRHAAIAGEAGQGGSPKPLGHPVEGIAGGQ